MCSPLTNGTRTDRKPTAESVTLDRPTDNMDLQQLPLEEADIPTYYSIQAKAMAEMGRLLYPRGPPPEAVATSNARTVNTLRKGAASASKFLKIVDANCDEPGRILGVAAWDIVPAKSLTERQAEEAEAAGAEIPPGMDEEFAVPFFKAVRDCRRRYLGGEPYICLQVLATLPEMQGQGVGKKAMQWGLEEARRRGLPIYLESTPVARAFYERMGFKIVGYLEWDGKVEGKEMEFACMVRRTEA